MVKIISKEPLNYNIDFFEKDFKVVLNHEQQEFDKMKSLIVNRVISGHQLSRRCWQKHITFFHDNKYYTSDHYKNITRSEEVPLYHFKPQQRTQDTPNKPRQIDEDRTIQISNRFYIFLRSIFLTII